MENIRKPDNRQDADTNIVDFGADKPKPAAYPLAGTIEGFITQERIKGVLRLLLHIFFVAIGAGAAYVSFLIEKESFQQITANAAFSFWIVLIFESAKVGTIVIYDRGYLREGAFNGGNGITWLVHLFKCLLILLSFTCSLAFISLSLDRPNLAETRAGDLQAAEQRFDQQTGLAMERHEAEMSGLKAAHERRFTEEHQRIAALYEPRIRNLQAELRKEMENKGRSGEFRGRRYREFERLLTNAKAEYKAELHRLSEMKAAAAGELTQTLSEKEAALNRKLQGIAEQKETAIHQIRTDNYADDDRAANKMLVATLGTINDGILSPIFGTRMEQVVFSTLFALMIALLLEMTIYICIYSINLSSPESEVLDAIKKKPSLTG